MITTLSDQGHRTRLTARSDFFIKPMLTIQRGFFYCASLGILNKLDETAFSARIVPIMEAPLLERTLKCAAEYNQCRAWSMPVSRLLSCRFKSANLV